MDLSNAVMAYKDDIVTELQALIGIRSVRGPALPGKLYGEGPAEALRYMMDLCARLGLTCTDTDGYAGHAEIGPPGDGYAAVVCHLDVVHEGDGWSVPPFGGLLRDGVIYGRGAVDDKGPAVVAAFCMRALLDAGVSGVRPMRYIFGADEECGMSDLEYYFSRHPLPKYAFAPDFEYPIVNCEKGRLRFDVTLPPGPAVERLSGGKIPNGVPDSCVARLRPGDYSVDAMRKSAEAYASGEFGITVSPAQDGGLELCSTGLAAHAMRCHDGFNAAMNMVRFLCDTLGRQAVGEGLWGINKLFGMETGGASAGVACADGDSGALTLNVGVVELSGDGGRVMVDIRYPVCANGEQMLAAVRARAQEYSLGIEPVENSSPLFLPPEHELIKRLSAVYTRVTGQPAQLLKTGGNTYAHAMRGRGVCFGPLSADSGFNGVHCADERIGVDALMQHARICVNAMAELMR